MQIYYFSNFLNNLTGGHFEVLIIIGSILMMMGLFEFIRTDCLALSWMALRWIIIFVIGTIPVIMEPELIEVNIVYQNVINKPFESISDQEDAFIHIKTYEIDKNKKQVYLESKVHSFHKSLEIENVDGQNIITKED
jgi:hypothetical protein